MSTPESTRNLKFNIDLSISNNRSQETFLKNKHFTKDELDELKFENLIGVLEDPSEQGDPTEEKGPSDAFSTGIFLNWKPVEIAEISNKTSGFISLVDRLITREILQKAETNSNIE